MEEQFYVIYVRACIGPDGHKRRVGDVRPMGETDIRSYSGRGQVRLATDEEVRAAELAATKAGEEEAAGAGVGGELAGTESEGEAPPAEAPAPASDAGGDGGAAPPKGKGKSGGAPS